ncbi:MAG: adenosylcobalamin-dependent ribonucleoside-diphosphate reductase [Pseudomonadota bacterium]
MMDRPVDQVMRFLMPEDQKVGIYMSEAKQTGTLFDGVAAASSDRKAASVADGEPARLPKLNVAPVSRQIWDMKYRFKGADGTPVDKTLTDSWRRVAKALAEAEDEANRPYWEEAFFRALDDFKFLPAGRILAGAGTGRDVTLFNCFVMGRVPDNMGGIFENLKEAALTMQQGGGIGYDFSTLRPKGAVVKGVGADASGPLSFMDVWDAMCRTIMSAGYRRGAMMATMRCDHPDIESFIAAKQDPGRLRMFNLSVLVTDEFMDAVKHDRSWDLIFDNAVFKTLKARDLWDQIMRSTYAYAEPGVIFIDRINQRNNLGYCETIFATNPCGEQPLPPYGACLLGSINLTRFVDTPFEDGAELDLSALTETVRTAVRMMDNVVDVSRFPLEAQAEEARQKRRIGLGVTGLADALIMCGVRYGSDASLKRIRAWMSAIQNAAYAASADLAAEKGAFPLFEKDAYLASPSLETLDDKVREKIETHGIRNALVTSIAPTGTISLYADNVSSGLEPVFSFTYTRKVLMPNGERKEEQVSDYAYRLYCERFGEEAPLPDYFVTALTLSPNDHVKVQAAVQEYVDSSISKTINCPEDISFEAFKTVYQQAYDLGCKGCTTYRPNDVTGSVLSAEPSQENQPSLDLEEESSSSSPKDVFEAGGVVYMTQPLDRPEVLPGKTYKVRWPEAEHAMYITINDVIQDGRRRPFEVFINSKSLEHYAWTVALTRMISAVFRRGGDVSFVVEELKAVFDPRGGQWVAGRYIPSLLAAIGEVIEQHLIAIGFIERGGNVIPAPAPTDARAAQEGSAMATCPKCSMPSLVRQEGCDTCMSCGYSKCG